MVPIPPNFARMLNPALGWPQEVQSPGTEGWEASAVTWLQPRRGDPATHAATWGRKTRPSRHELCPGVAPDCPAIPPLEARFTVKRYPRKQPLRGQREEKVMIHLKIGPARLIDAATDPMGREWAGWTLEQMPQEIYERNRGVEPLRWGDTESRGLEAPHQDALNGQRKRCSDSTSLLASMRRRPVSSRTRRTACTGFPCASSSSTSALPCSFRRAANCSPARRSASCRAARATRTGRGHDRRRGVLPSPGTS